MTKLGAGWKILKITDLSTISIGGPSGKMGSINMHKGTGVTEVQSVTHGPVILRAANNALIYPDQLRFNEKESLLCLTQMREFGIIVDKCPHKFG